MTPGPMDESNEQVEQAMGMTLDRGRDVAALSYINCWLRLMCRELGMDNLANEQLQAMASEMVTALNSGMEIAFCAMVGDRRMADRALGNLRAIVEEIPA